ncbi:MAG TPA: hypothetical protein VMU05_19285 [Dongiaceae bacterium]|nr:hypothetical protein [Dongiaceae bacterium]
MKASKVRELTLAVLTYTALAAFGQQCPGTRAKALGTASEVRTLEGRLVFHDSIRKWFELKLDQPQCGQTSIELMRINADWTPVEVLRGCRVRSHGTIDFSPTGYYSLDTYQAVEQIDPVGECARQSPFPDYSKSKPDRSVREYRVEMRVDYEPGDHPIVFHVSHTGKELQPWQAYASYMLTGGFVLYGYCGKGFVVDEVFGTPEANPSHFTERGSPDDWAAFNPESAAASGNKELKLGYTCVRRF